MATAEHREPCDSRGSCTVLGAPGGETPLGDSTIGLVLPHVQEGKLRALAVNGTKRSSVLPDVPTTKEAGIANAEYPIWFGLFLPAKAPSEVVQKLHGETLKALQSPKVRDKLTALGIDAMPMSPAEFRVHVQREIVSNTELVKAAGLKAQ